MAGYFALRTTESGGFMFTLRAANHQVILCSQLYASRQSALDGIQSVRTNSQIAARFERKRAKDDSPYFVLNAANGQGVGTSEMYSSNTAMENGIRSVMANGAADVIKDLG